MTLLQTEGLTKHFGGLVALDNLDLELKEGELLGLIGPNGSGKSTFFNVITGFLPRTSGKVMLKGENISGSKPHVIAKKGMVRTFQHMTLWPDFTVLDTLRVALQMKSGIGPIETMLNTPTCRRKKKKIDERAMEILKFVGMDHLTDQVAGTLSHGYQRTLSLGIGVITSPALLLLDEPVTALSPERRKNLMDLIKQLRESGTTAIIIEHDMRAIFDVCDRVVVINHGTKIAEGTPSEIKKDPVVISAYLGVKANVT